MKMITPEELFKRIKAQDELTVVDVRSEEKYNEFHIEGASLTDLNIPKTEIFRIENESKQVVPGLPTNKELIITCTTGNSATKCAHILSERSYDVVVLEGGITAWKKFVSDNI